MKLNFWQWLGIILLLVGAIGYVMFRDKPKPAPEPPAGDVQPPAPMPEIPPPATQPVP